MFMKMCRKNLDNINQAHDISLVSQYPVCVMIPQYQKDLRVILVALVSDFPLICTWSGGGNDYGHFIIIAKKTNLRIIFEQEQTGLRIFSFRNHLLNVANLEFEPIVGSLDLPLPELC